MNSAILERLKTLLERTPPFDRLDPTLRADVLGDITLKVYDEGEVILEQHSTQHRGLYVVESGLVRLMDVDQQRLIDKCGEGDVFGSFGLMKGGAVIYEAKAVEPTVCALLSGSRFQQLFDGNEEFAAYFKQDLKQYFNRLGSQLDVAGQHVLLTRRLYQLTHREPVTVAQDATAQQAARLMRKEGIGSLAVLRNGKLVGILTDRDLRTRLIASGKALDTPVRRLMSSPVTTISDQARVLDAMHLMLETGVYRLVIVREDDGAPVGLLTDRDLVHFRGQDPVATLRRVSHVTSTGDLAEIRQEASQHLLQLYRQGVQPEMLNAIITLLYDRLMERVLHLTEQSLHQAAGEERVDLPWAWLRMGIAGRKETALSSEKYGALVYANPADDEEAARAERWFRQLFEDANAALEVCGFRTSDEATSDQDRCLSLRSWKKTYRTWIFQSEPEQVGAVAPFFDLRCVYGDRSLFEALRLDVEDALNVQAMDEERNVLALLAEQAIEHRPPLSFFGRFVLERSGEERATFNIWHRGLRPIVDVARVLALELRYLASSNTLDRLRHAAQALPEHSDVLTATVDAYRFLVDFRLAHQLRAVEANEPPNSQIDPNVLTRMQRNLLRAAFGTVSDLQEAVAKRYHVTGRRRLL